MNRPQGIYIAENHFRASANDPLNGAGSRKSNENRPRPTFQGEDDLYKFNRMKSFMRKHLQDAEVHSDNKFVLGI